MLVAFGTACFIAGFIAGFYLGADQYRKRLMNRILRKSQSTPKIPS